MEISLASELQEVSSGEPEVGGHSSARRQLARYGRALWESAPYGQSIPEVVETMRGAV